MNLDERLLLSKMIKANDVSDQTSKIRELKHSHQLQEDINKLLKLKHRCQNDPNFNEKAIEECPFLFSSYTDIFNKIKKDEIDLRILNRFLNVLRDIEDENIDQHEGSYVIGSLLKELYVDSALKKSQKLDSTGEPSADNYEAISYKDFKQSLNYKTK